MKPKTEELLYLMLWACNLALRPTFRNLTASFESWAYRNGFQRQLVELERRRLLETKPGSNGGRLHRLTGAGRRQALGVRDPVTCWKRRWDGKWRIVLFDVPQYRASERARLRRSLAERGFGCLQNSVWISPHPLTVEREALGGDRVDVESLILLEARPCAGESDADIVAGAWGFDAINELYERHSLILRQLPRQPVTNETAARRLHRWFHEERMAWSGIMRLDPLLPGCLHPSGYPGIKAWKQRRRTLGDAIRLTSGFQSAR